MTIPGYLSDFKPIRPTLLTLRKKGCIFAENNLNLISNGN